MTRILEELGWSEKREKPCLEVQQFYATNWVLANVNFLVVVRRVL